MGRTAARPAWPCGSPPIAPRTWPGSPSVAQRIGGAAKLDSGFRVLVVEDNALVASMYAAALRRLSETDGVPGLGIEVASDGAAAFDRLLRSPPVDLVVTDVFMPIVSGITLVERIRAEPTLAHLPVVVITGGGERERERLAGLGVSLSCASR